MVSALSQSTAADAKGSGKPASYDPLLAQSLYHNIIRGGSAAEQTQLVIDILEGLAKEKEASDEALLSPLWALFDAAKVIFTSRDAEAPHRRVTFKALADVLCRGARIHSGVAKYMPLLESIDSFMGQHMGAFLYTYVEPSDVKEKPDSRANATVLDIYERKEKILRSVKLAQQEQNGSPGKPAHLAVLDVFLDYVHEHVVAGKDLPVMEPLNALHAAAVELIAEPDIIMERIRLKNLKSTLSDTEKDQLDENQRFVSAAIAGLSIALILIRKDYIVNEQRWLAHGKISAEEAIAYGTLPLQHFLGERTHDLRMAPELLPPAACQIAGDLLEASVGDTKRHRGAVWDVWGDEEKKIDILTAVRGLRSLMQVAAKNVGEYLLSSGRRYFRDISLIYREPAAPSITP